MRITSCHIKAFGCFSDLALENLDAPLVVVTGPNEAGKSTFFRFLRSMMYGFRPARADQHPYQPAGSGHLEGGLHFRMNDETEAAVSRKLMSAPKGTLEIEGRVSDLRNSMIPAVEHIPRVVYESVFAVTLHDMAALDEKAWQEVEQRLLGGMTMEHLRTVSTVLSEIENEAGKLWRPTRRGNPMSRQLTDKLKELKKDLSEATENDRRLRDLMEQIALLKERRAVLKERDLELTSGRRILAELVPIRKAWLQIEELRDRAGDMSELSDLPDDPAGRLEQLETDAREADENLLALNDEIAQLEKAVTEYESTNRDILSYRSEVRSWIRRTESHQEKRKRIAEKSEQVKRLETQLNERFPVVCGEAFSPEGAERIRQLSGAQLGRATERLRQTLEALGSAQAEKRLLTLKRSDTLFMVLAAAFSIASVALFVAWWQLSGVAYLLGAGGALLAGIVFAAVAVVQRSHIRTAVASLRIADLKQERQARQQRIRSMLGDLVPQEGGDSITPEDVVPLLALRDLVVSWHNTVSEAAALTKEVDTETAAVRGLAEACGVPAEGEPVDLLLRLDEQLRKQEAEEVEVKGKAERLNACLLEKKKLKTRQSSANMQSRRLRDRLEREGDGELANGILEIDKRRTAWSMAREQERRLRREAPDLDDRLRKIRAKEHGHVAFPADDAALDRLDAERDEVRGELGEVENKLSVKEAACNQLYEATSADEIASRIAVTEHEREEVCRRHDRLALLASILRLAEKRYRELHQPDVLKRAGAALAVITGGRYDRLMIEEGSPRIMVASGGSGAPMPAEAPLSQGTRDQVYLSLRMAIVDQLDKTRERLPIIMDEVFVNWDKSRRRSGIALLAEMARTRQVFVFTCHPWFADEMAERAKATIIRLPEGVV